MMGYTIRMRCAEGAWFWSIVEPDQRPADQGSAAEQTQAMEMAWGAARRRWGMSGIDFPEIIVEHRARQPEPC